jgi:hypothetical protein
MYQGTEPSPKGLGYCAHAGQANNKRKGRDGNMWIISTTQQGVKRWIKLTAQRPYIKGSSGHHPTKQYNDPFFLTHDNGGRPFIVYLPKGGGGKLGVSVYRIPKGSTDPKPNRSAYTQLVFSSNKVARVWIGKSPKNRTTEPGRGYGRAFDGNSILVQHNDLDYTFIGNMIFSFRAYAPITHFVSPVGNNDVPYPYAIDQDGCNYLFAEHKTIKSIPSEFADPYDYYYAIFRDKRVKSNSGIRPFSQRRIVVRRL